jgi:alpha-glucosidase (family GH31 glycosyl hydrolase)
LYCHWCRYGYNSIEECQEVVDNYTRVGVPLEVFISDSQYMNRSKLFTLDPVAYPPKKVQVGFRLGSDDSDGCWRVGFIH